MSNFEKIKKWYQEGRWDIQRVYNVVGRPSGITKEEYQAITGFVYPVKE
ncbi:MAG: XkdX family protein [Lachnospiraceae bacterium]|jgi:hypothetical protein|nr:XkdX family protein [Lachnospiraceae bacterium]